MNTKNRTVVILNEPSKKATEVDCACPDTGTGLSASELSFAHKLWQKSKQLYQAELPQKHTLHFSPITAAGAGVVVLNEPARQILDTFTQPRSINNNEERELARLGLLHPCDAPSATIDSQPHTLTAWLHVTNACNLRCTYCYLEKTDEAMDEATGRAAVDAIFRSALNHGFGAVKLKYAGGEATLNFGLIRWLHHYAQEKAAAQDLELREVVLSNGVGLKDDVISFVRDAGMRLMISLDRLNPVSEGQRIFINGRSSAHLAACTIDRAVAQGVRPHLSITITKHNADQIADVVRFALERELLFNLNFYRENDYTAGHEDLLAEDDQLITGTRAAFRVMEENPPQQSVIAALIDRSNFASPHQRACGAGHNYLVIDQNGRIARCQMEIEQPVTSVLAADPLQEVRGYAEGFQNLAVAEKEGCRDCTWRYWCAGGCPLLTYRVTGRSDVKSPYCNVYKALYPELLALEGRRLLHAHGIKA